MDDKEKIAWALIPSIDFEIDESNCKRKLPRTNLLSVKKALDENLTYLSAKIATPTINQCKGMIIDINENGCRIIIPVQLKEGEWAKVGFIVNKRPLIFKAIIRWVSFQSHFYLAGMEFQGVPDDAKEVLMAISAVAMLDTVETAKMEQVLR